MELETYIIFHLWWLCCSDRDIKLRLRLQIVGLFYWLHYVDKNTILLGTPLIQEDFQNIIVRLLIKKENC
jgi:hypothetical protein